MFLLYYVLPFIFLQKSIFGTLIITFGTPYDVNWCYQYDNEDWNSCLDLCEENDDCIMTYMSSEICYSCEIGQVYSVITNDTNKFAFKSENLDFCYAKILDKYNASNYTIEFDGTYWVFNYFDGVTKQCDDGWVLSNRNDGIQWCISMVEGDFQGDTKGEDICEDYDAILSGINNAFEQQYLLRHGWEIASKLGKCITTLIDGYMNDRCFCSVKTDVCKLPESYVEYDNYSINPIIYDWYKNNPDINEDSERCLGVYSQKGNSTVDGKVNTLPCDTEPFHVAYCGKLAT